MSGGGKQTTTQTSNSEPWDAAQPNLKMGLEDAATLYQSGGAAPVNTMSTVIPWSQRTEQGMDAQTSLAQNNMGGAGLSGMMQGVVDAGGFTPDQQKSMTYLDSIGDNAFDLSGNQAYQTYRDTLADDVSQSVNMNAAGAGRYGSGQHTANLVDELTGALSQADLAQMGRMDNLNQQRFNAGQQGMSNVSAAYDAQKTPLADMMQVGAMDEDLAGRVRNDELRIAQEQQTAPMRAIEWLNAISSGAGSMGGSSVQTSQMPGQNPFLTAASYGLAGLGGIGSIF